MTKTVTVNMVDDIDDTRADETVTFGLDGSTYEIDLGSNNAAKLRSVVRAWADAARPAQEPEQYGDAEGRRLHPDRLAPNAAGDWPRQPGHDVGDPGDCKQEPTNVADRDHIVHDLHDHVIQQLFAAGMSLQGTIARADSPMVVTERLGHTLDDLQDIVDDIRATIYWLQLPVQGG